MDNILSLLQLQAGFGAVIKIGILILLGVYAAFAFVVLNQIRVMNRLVSISLGSTIIVVLGVLHLLLALSLFVLSLAIL